MPTGGRPFAQRGGGFEPREYGGKIQIAVGRRI